MTRDELLDKICPADSITDCCSSDCIFGCDDCKVTLGYMLDEYEADIKAETIDEFYNLLLDNKNEINASNYPWNYIELVIMKMELAAMKMTEPLKEQK